MERFCGNLKDCVACAVKACYWLKTKAACHFQPVNGSGIADRELCASRTAAVTTTTEAIETRVRAAPLSNLASFGEPSPLVQGLTEREIVLLILLAVVSALFLVVTVVLLLLKWPFCGRILRDEPSSLDVERLIESSTDASSVISNHPTDASTPLPRPDTTAPSSSSTEDDASRAPPPPRRLQQQQRAIPLNAPQATQTAYFTSSESSGGDFEQVELTPPRALRPRPVPTPLRFTP